MLKCDDSGEAKVIKAVLGSQLNHIDHCLSQRTHELAQLISQVVAAVPTAFAPCQKILIAVQPYELSKQYSKERTKLEFSSIMGKVLGSNQSRDERRY